MTTTRARVLPFIRRPVAGEARSPFRHLMPARQLTPREILHRRRMIDAYDYTAKPFSASNRTANVWPSRD